MFNGHTTRTVLANSMGLSEFGSSVYGVPHLREDGHNSDVRIFQLNDDGSETYLRTEPVDLNPKSKMFRRRDL